MRSTQQVVSDFRRNEIVDAARTVFARRGFAGGIIDEIAREAGIAKGTVYLYFRSKTEIYKAVLDRDMESLTRGTVEAIDRAPSLKDKIAAYTLVRLENAEAKKEFFRIMDGETSALSIPGKQYRHWLREPVTRLAAAIEEAAQNGLIRPVPAEKVAWMIVDLTRASIQQRLSGKDDALAREEAEFLSSFIWAALSIEGPAQGQGDGRCST